MILQSLFLKKSKKLIKVPALLAAAGLLTACSGSGEETVPGAQIQTPSTFAEVSQTGPATPDSREAGFIVKSEALSPAKDDSKATPSVIDAVTTSAITPQKKPNILIILADDMGYSDIGAFGSEIETPNLDKLAARGRILTNYHTSALCAVTRSMLMTGTDHHLVGQGSMGVGKNKPRYGKPGYEDYLNDDALPVAQLLKDAGYHTYMAGKWHLGVGITEKHGPEDKGFEKSFFWNDQHPPHYFDLNVDYQTIDEDGATMKTVEKGPVVYASNLYADKIIEDIDLHKGDGKPFFAYLAFHTPHAPLQAVRKDIDKYAGKYKKGYDVIHKDRIERQKLLGLVPTDYIVNKLDPAWDKLTEGEKTVSAHSMAIYAAMVDNLDQNVGRVIDHLEKIGELENTFIVFHSDNGAPGSEETRLKNFGRNSEQFVKEAGTPGGTLKGIDKVEYGKGWATVSNAPFSGYKTDMLEGGTSSPTIVVLPGQTTALPRLTQLAHVTDLVPTLLEVAGITPPATPADVIHVADKRIPKIVYQNKQYFPITGKSLLGWLKDDSNASIIHKEPVIDELNSQVYVKTDKWKALWRKDSVKWELFDFKASRVEPVAIPGSPDKLTKLEESKLKELVEAWEKYEVLNGVAVTYDFEWPTTANNFDRPRTRPTGGQPTNDDDPND